MTKWPEFDSLIALQGMAYIEMRNRILKSNQLSQAIIQEAEPEETWQPRVHREILRGWRENSELFMRVQAELNDVNVEFERKKITSVSGIWTRFSAMATRVYKEPVLPLCWEALMKLRGVIPEWQQLTYLHMTSVLPHSLSVEPIIEFLYLAPEAAVADLAGRVLETMPAEAALQAIDRRLTEPSASDREARYRGILSRTKERLAKRP